MRAKRLQARPSRRKDARQDTGCSGEWATKQRNQVRRMVSGTGRSRMGRRATAREGTAAEIMDDFGWVRCNAATMGRVCAEFIAARKHAEGAQQPAAIEALGAMPLPAGLAARRAQHGAGSKPASRASNSARVAAGRMGRLYAGMPRRASGDSRDSRPDGSRYS
jgi:hypothetical protein